MVDLYIMLPGNTIRGLGQALLVYIANGIINYYTQLLVVPALLLLFRMYSILTQVLQSCLLVCYYAESTTADEFTQGAPTYISESMSVLNATDFPDYSLEHSDLESSIVDHASMSDEMVGSNPSHSTHYHQAFDSEALSPTLSLPLSISKGDPCGVSDHYDRSRSMPPVNHQYQQESAYFHTPIIRKQHPHIQRRYTYPPAPGYSLYTPSTSDLVSLLCSVHELYIHVIHIHVLKLYCT